MELVTRDFALNQLIIQVLDYKGTLTFSQRSILFAYGMIHLPARLQEIETRTITNLPHEYSP
jgi:hypothetical protein